MTQTSYLMKSMGFDVQALRGGLSAWDGPSRLSYKLIFNQRERIFICFA